MVNSIATEGGLRFIGQALAAWDRLAQGAIIVTMISMVAIVSAQVFLRYVLNSSIGWADEVSRLTFVWTIFLAIPLGIKAGVHLGIDILVTRLPAGPRIALMRLVTAVSAALMLLVFYESAIITYDQWDEKMASVNLSAGWFVLAVAAGSAHAALHLVWAMLSGETPVAEPNTAEGTE